MDLVEIKAKQKNVSQITQEENLVRDYNISLDFLFFILNTQH